MKLANSPSWRRDLPAEDLASIRAAVSGRQEHRHSGNRSPKRLRLEFGPLVGARP